MVRDNGAIMRIPKKGCEPTKYDSIWTFGKQNKEGYMLLAGDVRVHRIVCTAFNGLPRYEKMVVDHIDTIRSNNRPENLRWLTRIENVLKNEITRNRIIYHCGSIEAFLDNPSLLREKAMPPKYDWMRTITKEEAANCKENMKRLLESNNTKSSGRGLGEWVFHKHNAINPIINQESTIDLKDSLTPNAKQLNWKIPTEFPLCPADNESVTLQTYFNSLENSKIITHNQYGSCEIIDFGYNSNDDAIYVLTHGSNVKPWALCKITKQDNYFIHENKGSAFSEDGGRKKFTLAMGREWTGGDSIDDYC